MECDAETDAVRRVVEDVLRDAVAAGRVRIDVVYGKAPVNRTSATRKQC